MRYRGKQLSLVMALFLTGCNTSYDSPLVFLQTTTVGISAGTPAAGAAAPDLSLGYRDVDVAVVPVVAAGQPVRGQSPGPAGGGAGGALDNRMLLAATTPSGAGGPEYSDALSVLGQFSVNTGQQSQGQQLPSVGLGKFFATGLAARQLAYGFGCQLSNKCQ